MNKGYLYDVNSLFPAAMLLDMPIGIPILVKGDINLDDFFGFLYVEIDTKDVKFPFLPVKNNGSLIVPLGKWKGWYFSEELKYAKNLGYNIEILGKGYKFNRGRPFNNYVNHFYDLKANASDSVEREIAKLF
jgi:hypothetical protein